MTSRHGTLVGAAVTTVTLDADYRTVEVTNVDGAAAIYFTIDGSTPTVAGNDTEVLPATICSRVITSRSGTNPTVVKMISSGTPGYCVSAE